MEHDTEEDHMQKIKEIIKANLKVGKENAITRKELVSLCKVSDRKIRDVIREMRNKDMEPICSTSGNAGYYYPKTADEAIQCRNEKKKRAKSNFEGVPALEKFIKERSQVKIEFKDYER